MRFILDFIDGTSIEIIDDYLNQYDCTTVSTLNQLGLVYLVDAPSAPETKFLFK